MWRQRGDAQRVCMSEREREREEKMRWTERKKEIKARVSGFPFGWKDQVLVSNLEKRLKTAGKERSGPESEPFFVSPLLSFLSFSFPYSSKAAGDPKHLQKNSHIWSQKPRLLTRIWPSLFYHPGGSLLPPKSQFFSFPVTCLTTSWLWLLETQTHQV